MSVLERRSVGARRDGPLRPDARVRRQRLVASTWLPREHALSCGEPAAAAPGARRDGAVGLRALAAQGSTGRRRGAPAP